MFSKVVLWAKLLQHSVELSSSISQLLKWDDGKFISCNVIISIHALEFQELLEINSPGGLRVGMIIEVL